MKKLGLLVLSLGMIAIAAPSERVTKPHPVKIDSASYRIVGSGRPITHVQARATFSNPCIAPKAGEVVVKTSYKDNYGTLVLSVAKKSLRVCPMIYKPVQVTLDLGKHVRPNDGNFRKIIVNGVVATQK